MKTNTLLKTTLVFIMLFHFIPSFTQPIVVSGTSDNDVIGRTCRMANGHLITVMERNPDWGSGDLYATFSTDDGESWDIASPIITDAGNQSTFSLVLTNDTLALFYASNENGNYKIYSIQSIDGINWINKKQLDLGWNANQQYYGPMVIVEEDHSLTMVYIGWGGGAYIAHCPFGGSWDTEKQLVQSGAYRARVCKNNGAYLISYHRNIGGNYDIHVKSSFNRKNWSPEIDITNNGNSHDAYCNTTPDGKYILYYAKHEPMAYNICRKDSENGIDWSEEKFITEDDVNNTQPSFFVEESMIYLTWTHAIDYDSNNDIYLQKFDYLTSINNTEPLSEPIVYFNSSTKNLLIKNIPFEEKIELSISDLSGKLVFSMAYTHQEQISIPHLTYLRTGMYIVNIQFKNERFSEKLVVVE